MARLQIRFHKDHQIQARADEDTLNNTWKPKALIAGDEPHQYHTLFGPDPCQTQDEAVQKAVDLAIAWIDREYAVKSMSGRA